MIWRTRGLLRTTLLWLCLVLPLWVGGIIAGASLMVLLIASAVVLAHLLIWWLIASWVANKDYTSAVNLVSLIGVWVVLAVITPAAIKAGVNVAVPIPDGGDILLTQREAVNDAWDLPKQATFEPFVKRHPELADYAKIDTPFEWKWYYAFQQVGDQNAESLSHAYLDGRIIRDAITSSLALLSPPVLTERLLQKQAQTDVAASIAYEESVRAYHADLRSWYYPKLFKDTEFDTELLSLRPQYSTD